MVFCVAKFLSNLSVVNVEIFNFGIFSFDFTEPEMRDMGVKAMNEANHPFNSIYTKIFVAFVSMMLSNFYMSGKYDDGVFSTLIVRVIRRFSTTLGRSEF